MGFANCVGKAEILLQAYAVQNIDPFHPQCSVDEDVTCK